MKHTLTHLTVLIFLPLCLSLCGCAYMSDTWNYGFSTASQNSNERALQEKRVNYPDLTFEQRWPDTTSSGFQVVTVKAGWNCKVTARASTNYSSEYQTGRGSSLGFTSGYGLELKVDNLEPFDLELEFESPDFPYGGISSMTVKAKSKENHQTCTDKQVDLSKLSVKGEQSAPSGWKSPWHQSLHDIFHKVESERTDSTVYVTYTFWNRRPEPVIIEYVITEPGLNAMPDYQRHAGGGTIILKGGETSTVSKSVNAPANSWENAKWQIWAIAKPSVLE